MDCNDAEIFARILLGFLACALLIGACFGVFTLVDSLNEASRLAATSASGSDYLGIIISYALAVILIAPALPAALLGFFAMHTSSASIVAARAALVLWWVIWLLAFAVVAMPPGLELDVLVARVALMFILALGPAISSVCVYIVAHDKMADGF